MLMMIVSLAATDRAFVGTWCMCHCHPVHLCLQLIHATCRRCYPVQDGTPIVVWSEQHAQQKSKNGISLCGQRPVTKVPRDVPRQDTHARVWTGQESSAEGNGSDKLQLSTSSSKSRGCIARAFWPPWTDIMTYPYGLTVCARFQDSVFIDFGSTMEDTDPCDESWGISGLEARVEHKDNKRNVLQSPIGTTCHQDCLAQIWLVEGTRTGLSAALQPKLGVRELPTKKLSCGGCVQPAKPLSTCVGMMTGKQS
eukprot:5934153-Amphidinium_carterae.1